MTVCESTGLGARLRHFRRVRGLTLKEVAEKVGCTESMVSKLENQRATPSLPMLRRLTTALEINISMLFADDTGDGVVSRQGQRPRVDTDPLRSGPGVALERLVPHHPSSLLQANVHIIAAGGSSDGLITHVGEEMGYLLDGLLELEVNGQRFVIRPGDSFHFRSELPHGYRNLGSTEARVLWVNTPPTF